MAAGTNVKAMEPAGHSVGGLLILSGVIHGVVPHQHRYRVYTLIVAATVESMLRTA